MSTSICFVSEKSENKGLKLLEKLKTTKLILGKVGFCKSNQQWWIQEFEWARIDPSKRTWPLEQPSNTLETKFYDETSTGGCHGSLGAGSATIYINSHFRCLESNVFKLAFLVIVSCTPGQHWPTKPEIKMRMATTSRRIAYIHDLYWLINPIVIVSDMHFLFAGRWWNSNSYHASACSPNSTVSFLCIHWISTGTGINRDIKQRICSHTLSSGESVFTIWIWCCSTSDWRN